MTGKSNTAQIHVDADFNRFLQEVAQRLKEQYLKEHGSEFKFGTFRFVFHKGRFQGVEECLRNKKYFSPFRETDQED